MNDHSTAIIYVRVSSVYQTGKSNDSKYSSGPVLNGQIEICKRFYNDMFPRRLDPVVVSDVGSSFNNKNKLVNLDNMINDMEENTLIIIHDISRLGRNVYQTFSNVYESVELKKSKIYSVIDKKLFGNDRLEDIDFFRQSVEAEAESAKRSTIAKERNNYIRSIGGHVGKVPFGKKVRRIKTSGEYMKRVLINDAVQQRSIRKIIQMYNDDFKQSEIKNELAKRGYTNNEKTITVGIIRGVINKYKNSNESNELANDLAKINIDFNNRKNSESDAESDLDLENNPDSTLILNGKRRKRQDRFKEDSMEISKQLKRRRQNSPLGTTLAKQGDRNEDDFINETSLLIHNDKNKKHKQNSSVVRSDRVRTRSMSNSEKSTDDEDYENSDDDDEINDETRLYKRIKRNLDDNI